MKWYRIDVCQNADGVAEVVKSFSVLAESKEAAFDIGADSKFSYYFETTRDVRIAIREE